jgi:hypothetical protein
MKSILCVSLLILMMPSAHAATLPGESAEGKRLHDANCRYWHLHPQGPNRSVFGCSEEAVGRLKSYGNQRILHDETQNIIKYLNDQFYQFR